MKDNKPKRIGIDARFYGPVGKGLGRYTQEIVDNIIKIDNFNEYVIFFNKDNFEEFKLESEKVKKIMVNVRWYTLAEQVLMPYYIWKNNLDLMHFPHFNVPLFCPTKFIVTVHDLILTKYPTLRATTLSPLLYKIKNLMYKIVIWLAVKRAREVIAVSKYTKNDIVKHFKIKPEKIVVTYEGVANLAKNRDTLFTTKLDDEKTLLSYNINKPFLLYIGNAYPHKNLENLLDVFSKLHKYQPNLQLALVGKEEYFYKKIKNYSRDLELWQENKKETPIIFPGYVPDAQLEVLYKNALAYIFPSFYEGFGLPALEAMAKGCPVISSNKSSMPEILGEAAIYFNPENKEEMLEKIELVINDKDLQENLIEKGKNQVKKYSWWECASKTREVYEQVLN
ncbi:MAG: glycosyltransferase family 1 protein [Patescibacteria group bacterium]